MSSEIRTWRNFAVLFEGAEGFEGDPLFKKKKKESRKVKIFEIRKRDAIFSLFFFNFFCTFLKTLEGSPPPPYSIKLYLCQMNASAVNQLQMLRK